MKGSECVMTDDNYEEKGFPIKHSMSICCTHIGVVGNNLLCTLIF